MGFRFKKSFKIIPGVKLNVSKKGLSSVSLGGKGASMNFGKKGCRTTVGIPGTGMSYTSSSRRRRTRKKSSGGCGGLILLIIIVMVVVWLFF
ncbi:DUF4236 domain-containing protein [Moraxella sp. FZFQ2102]|uniref:DUF4236 domain-containing protein n=1 Tax=Moraxella sp. FZFQ2102 TaxID=2953752 RepID=UPI00209C3E8F|nr:DUF4236 domain-containing protein [Moraxella sp. FZFQ2102]USZ15743.1 DUF4236 domain-containing protein [Moraxella sp. FZFQ2102]